MSDDDLIRRTDALAEVDLYRIDWADAYDAIAALPAVSAPDVAELVEALRPFAEALKGNYSHQSDALPISMGHGKDDLRWVVLLGDFRRAAAALQSGGVEPADVPCRVLCVRKPDSATIRSSERDCNVAAAADVSSATALFCWVTP